VSYTIIFAQLRPSVHFLSCVCLTTRLFLRDITLLRSALYINSDVISKRIQLSEYVAYCNLRYKNKLQCRELCSRNVPPLMYVPLYIYCHGPLPDRDFSDLSWQLFG